jgi:hypothetical protein
MEVLDDPDKTLNIIKDSDQYWTTCSGAPSLTPIIGFVDTALDTGNVNRNTSIRITLKIDGRLSSDTQTVLWTAVAALRIFGSLPYRMLYFASITVLIPTLLMAPKVLYKLQMFDDRY